MPKTPEKTRSTTASSIKKQPASAPLISHASVKGPAEELNELLVSGIRQLYWAENHLVQNLPKIQEAAGNSPLRKAVADHWKVTKGHVARLEQVFGILGVPPQAQKCDGLEGLAMEGEGIIDTTKPGSKARIAGLIMACQKVENYETTAYKGLALLATKLGHADLTKLLEATLAEEEQASTLLSDLASKN